MLLSKNLGNTYTGSLYNGLVSLLSNSNLDNKHICMFSYGSGLMASMFTLHVRGDVSEIKRIINIEERLSTRYEVEPVEFDSILASKEKNYGQFSGKLQIRKELLGDGVFYLAEIDDKGRRFYNQHFSGLDLKGQNTSSQDLNKVAKRLQNLDHSITPNNDSFKGFYKMSIEDRLKTLNKEMAQPL